MTKKKVRFSMDVQLEQLKLVLTHTKDAIAYLTSQNTPHMALTSKEKERIASLKGLTFTQLKQLNSLILELEAYVSVFKVKMTPEALSLLQKQTKNVFAKDGVHMLKFTQDMTLYNHFKNVLIGVFRSFFRIFDVLFTLFSKQTMAEGETPFAQKLVGRKHFFEYPEKTETRLVKEAVKLNKEFTAALNQFEGVLLEPENETALTL